MLWSDEFADRLRENAPLGELTWFKLGGCARYMFSPSSEGELRDALRAAGEAEIEVRVLGGGANLLVRDDGFDGLVIRLDSPAFQAVEYDGTRVIAGGGADLMMLARDCAGRGLAGFECLAGVPGTVGGAIRMNAGGKYGSISDTVRSVRLMDTDGTTIDVRSRVLGFGYRSSLVGRRIVLGATFELSQEDAESVKERFHRIMGEKKASQPMAAHCAGCMFKNPAGESAGRLIDIAGLKGATAGKARVSELHGNFIVADDGATASDVLTLAQRVQTSVREQTGIDLEMEVEVW